MLENILAAADLLVQQRGLSAVTFQDIADEVNLRKPSLFHHLRNKEDLTLQLIARCETKYGADHQEIIARDISADKKLVALAEYFEVALHNERPCLLAAIAANKHSLTERAQTELEAVSQRAIERIAGIFRQGKIEGSLSFTGSPQHVAMSFYAMLQGLQTLCRASNDPSSFKKTTQLFINSVRATK